MPERKLPIRRFERREQDIQLVEPGGSSKAPEWILSKEQLSVRSQKLITAFEGIRMQVIQKEQENELIPVVFKARISEDALAKTHRKKISSLFRVRGRNNMLGPVDLDEVAVKVPTAKDADAIIHNLKNIDANAHALSAVTEIERFAPIVVARHEKDDYKVKLIDFQDYELNKAIRDHFEQAMGNLGFEITRTEYSPNHVVFKIKSVDADALQRIKADAAFDAVFSIEPMPKYRVGLDLVPDEQFDIPVLEPDEDRIYPVVGILDDGIADVPHLEPWIVDRWSSYPESVLSRKHGTFVSGIVVYGDRLQNEEWVGTNGFKLLDACVFPDLDKESISEDELVANIREVVKQFADRVKVWNLSISITEPIDDYSFSDFAVALDAIQEEYDVLICKSAGNCTNFMSKRPKGRLYQGADSVLSLTVGSIAHVRSSRDLADVDNPSPFSRIGPGPSFIVKPEVVHYGGNAGIDHQGALVQTGVRSFCIDGTLCESIGTSFSTPRVAAFAAGLSKQMDQEFDPLLIKAMVIHSAKYPEKLAIPIEERLNQVGFGRPERVSDVMFNAPHEATLVLRDELVQGEKIDIMDFPMPDCLIADGYYFGQIVVTLVYSPILDPSQRSEYCQSNIDVKLGTYTKKEPRDTSKRHIRNPIGRAGSQNLLLDSLYSKKKLKQNQEGFAVKERLLIQYGDKFYPAKKYAIDLSELTEGKTRESILLVAGSGISAYRACIEITLRRKQSGKGELCVRSSVC